MKKILIICLTILILGNSTIVFGQVKKNFEELETYLYKLAKIGEEAIKNFGEKAGRNWYKPLRNSYKIEIIDDEAIGCYVLIFDPEAYLYLGNGTVLKIEDPEDGYISLTKGFILELKNEAELAGCLIHELVHLMSKYDEVNPGNTDEEYLALELDIDRITILILAKLGYRSRAYADLSERLLTLEGSRRPVFSRPENILRTQILANKNLISGLELHLYNKKFRNFILLSKLEFERMKDSLKSGQ